MLYLVLFLGIVFLIFALWFYRDVESFQDFVFLMLMAVFSFGVAVGMLIEK
jgi:hypothetical protein